MNWKEKPQLSFLQNTYYIKIDENSLNVSVPVERVYDHIQVLRKKLTKY